MKKKEVKLVFFKEKAWKNPYFVATIETRIMIKKVCVYCASSDKISQDYFDGAAAMGQLLAENNITTVYGGGSAGLMGQLANAALAFGGAVIGIIPHFMTEVEWQHNGLTELIKVDDMRERKRLLLVDVDAVIALPGGTGTFEELLEVITLKRLGKFVKPIIIYNQNGYYDPMLAMFEKAIEEKFMGEQHRGIWTVIEEVEDLINAIKEAPQWDQSAINYAKV